MPKFNDTYSMPEPGTQTGPTAIERILYRTLDVMGVTYRAQCVHRFYTLDAHVYEPARLAIEADGCVVHGCPTCLDRGDPRIAEAAAKRRRRDGNLAEYEGVRVVHIWEHAFDTAATSRAAVESALWVRWRGPSIDDGIILYDADARSHAAPPRPLSERRRARLARRGW